MRVASGHTLTLSPIAVELRTEEFPHYERVTDSDGISRNSGGASALLRAEALSYDEAIALLDQFGLSLYTPAALCTIELPDVHRIPTIFYGVVEFEVMQTQGNWWSDFRLHFNGLIPTWQS